MLSKSKKTIFCEIRYLYTLKCKTLYTLLTNYSNNEIVVNYLLPMPIPDKSGQTDDSLIIWSWQDDRVFLACMYTVYGPWFEEIANLTDCYEHAAPENRRNLFPEKECTSSLEFAFRSVLKMANVYISVRLEFFWTLTKFTYYYERTAIDFFKEYYNCLPLLLVVVLIYFG